MPSTPKNLQTSVIDNDINEAEKPPPVRYILKRNSIAFQVISLMFPGQSPGIEEGGKMIDGRNFVSMMDILRPGTEEALRLPSKM